MGILNRLLPSLFPNSPHRRIAWRMSRWWYPDGHEAIASSLLRLIAVGGRERLMLAPLIRGLAEEHGFFARRRLNLLADRLGRGQSLVQALEQTPGLLSDDVVLSLRFASESGTLPSALEELSGREIVTAGGGKVSRGGSVSPLRQTLSYGVGLTVAFTLVTAFLVAFVAPTLRALYQDFGMRETFAFQWFMFVFQDLFFYFLPGLSLLLLVCVVVIWWMKPRRLLARGLSSRVLRNVASLRSASLLRNLARAGDAGRPIAGSLATLARYHYDHNVRAKLLYTRNEVGLGADPWSSLVEANLLERNEALAISEASPQLKTWLMQRLAQKREDRVFERRAILGLLAHPVMILAFGFLALWVCTAFFTVLLSLILALA